MHLNTDAGWIRQQIATDPAAFVAVCEQSFRRQIDAAAEQILSRPEIRLVMLAGPSSSGKTTTADRLKQAVSLRGRRAWVISLDDFYLDPSRPLLFEDGTPDYETVQALDLPYLETCLRGILQENRCMLPRFSFVSRQREADLHALQIASNDLVIVEGLHALNPVITDPIDATRLFRIYVSVSSRVTQKNDVLLSKRDLRFIRRMVRDNQFRASPVDFTFYLWNGVRKGEDRYLFPYSGRADLRIDSIHLYEPCVFRTRAVHLLQMLPVDSAYYDAALALQQKLSVFPALDPQMIPQQSLLHEFLG